ncbi:MAG: hypothetical protein RDV48_30160 [Candidatus Eremiobacteraeota bacterium]|nr:hypothetical protein [Candidatus Eremiobacteraeota bacterium]
MAQPSDFVTDILQWILLSMALGFPMVIFFLEEKPLVWGLILGDGVALALIISAYRHSWKPLWLVLSAVLCFISISSAYISVKYLARRQGAAGAAAYTLVSALLGCVFYRSYLCRVTDEIIPAIVYFCLFLFWSTLLLIEKDLKVFSKIKPYQALLAFLGIFALWAAFSFFRA